MSTRWSTLSVGGVIALSLTILFLFLGTGVGVQFIPAVGSDQGLLGLGILGGASLLAVVAAASFVGAYLATSLFLPATRREAMIHGLGMWGILTVTQTLIAGIFLAPTIGNTVGNAGAGLAAASFWEEFRKANPRIISDLKILDGKVVSTLDLNKSASLPHIVQSAEKNTEKILQNAKLENGKNATTGLALAGFFSLLLSALSSVAGAVVAHKRPAVKAVPARSRGHLSPIPLNA